MIKHESMAKMGRLVKDNYQYSDKYIASLAMDRKVYKSKMTHAELVERVRFYREWVRIFRLVDILKCDRQRAVLLSVSIRAIMPEWDPMNDTEESIRLIHEFYQTILN